ncbi:MAG TPA: hypothetical protein ENJ67_02520 [Sulfurimonas autotrophica]|uniref:Uncharacterized protein n=1 Tax=Sulfurimonas autotrophica TaxID=202747 RepID=A0A7C3CA41_9BACT|nr:hypothetical protein [Sulfurimonas autotrophica]
MKPLNAAGIPKLLERFDDFKGSEIRSLEVISPTEIQMSFALQDKARAYDWVTLTLLLSGVSDAKLVDASKLEYIDMSDGVSILYAKNLFHFAIGTYKTEASIKDALLYIVSENIKYDEGAF